MASSTNKRVVAVRFEREPVAGFVNPQTFLTPEGIELLTPSGAVAVLPAAEVKALCFVRDVDTPELWRPHRSFLGRPKTEGVWVRFAFRDGDTLEGLLPSNLLALEPAGFTVTPPDAGAFAARVFVPRAGIYEARVLGVIGAAAKRRAKPKPVPADQLRIFE